MYAFKEAMQAKEGYAASQTSLLRQPLETYSDNVPDFNPPYPIQQVDDDVTKIILHKRQCCNKMVTTLMIWIVLLAIYGFFTIWWIIGGEFLDGAWIAVLIFGLMVLIATIFLLKSISVLCQYGQTELYINRRDNIIQIYQPKMIYMYGNDAEINYGGICGCDFKPKITTICYLSDFINADIDDTGANPCIYLKFIDTYSRNQQYYIIKQSGKYAEFTACQYLNLIIKNNTN